MIDGPSLPAQDHVYRIQLSILPRKGLRRRSGGWRVKRYNARAEKGQGDLGWGLLKDSREATDGLKLGTAVGTGSYGIVREATYKGYKVRFLGSYRLPLSPKCPRAKA